MSKLKLAIIICGSALSLVTSAQGYELRIGNGSTITIPSSSDTAASVRNDMQSSSPKGGRPAKRDPRSR